MKILIVDDHALFRAGLELLLSQLLPNSVPIHISQAANARQALAMISSGNHYDLVLLDWYMPEMQGLEALLALRDLLAHGRVVVLSGDQNPKLVQQCIEHGAAGFIAKDSPTEQLYHALSVVASGGVYLPSVAEAGHVAAGAQLAVGMVEYSHHLKPFAEHFPVLSPRQCEVFKAMARGLSNKMIARELSVCEDTVKQHLSAVYQVLKVRNRTEAVYLMSQLGLSVV